MAIANQRSIETFLKSENLKNIEKCRNILYCGHPCSGLRDEKMCPPCLYRCDRNLDESIPGQTADDTCLICFTDNLASAPVIKINCGHLFHFHCIEAMLKNRWSGPRISFCFSQCPICKKPIEHERLQDLLQPLQNLYADVQRKARMRLEYEGLMHHSDITTPGAKYYHDPTGYAMEKYAYYLCFKCDKAYYGGEAKCNEMIELPDEYNPAELVCGACSNSRAQSCLKHGNEFMEFKCRYCCSRALFYCFGTTHFCNTCHSNHIYVTGIPKDKLPKCPAGPNAVQLSGSQCPLNVDHPPTGDEFSLGCGICENVRTF